MSKTQSYTDYLLEEQKKAQSAPASTSYADYLTKTYGSGGGAAAPTASGTNSTANALLNTGNTAKASKASVSYSDYLVGLSKATGGGQKQAVSAAPAPAGQSYADWLVTMQKNHQVENTPTNAMSYADYLLYMGSDPAGNYKATVKDANRAYADATHAHGKSKQAMVSTGLAGSGYGEYLVSQAYAERARAIENAQSVARTSMEQGKQSYADYLVNLRTENENAAYQGIVNGQLTGDAARRFAIEKGVTADRLDVILGQANTALATIIEQKNQAALAEASSAVSAALENNSNLTIDAAIAQLGGIYGADVLNKVKENLQASNASVYATSVNAATGVSNFKAMYDNALKTGQITQAQYDAQVQKGYETNYTVIQKALDSSDFSGLTKYATDNGLTVPVDTATTDAVVDHMAKNGAITGAQRNQYYFSQYLQSIQETDYSAKKAVGEVEELQKFANEGKITSEQHKQLLSALGARVKSEFGEVEITSYGLEEDTKCVTVRYKQREFGREAINFYLGSVGTPRDVEMVKNNFVIGTKLKIGNKKENYLTIGTVKGQPAYILRMDGQDYYYYNPDYNGFTNTKHNAAFVAWALTQGA